MKATGISALASLLISGALGQKETGDCKQYRWQENGTWISSYEPPPPSERFPRDVEHPLKYTCPIVGGINCRYWSHAYDKVGLGACQQLVKKYGITFEKLLELNQDLDPECKMVDKPKMELCTWGFVEPHWAWDGNCGPLYNEASCLGMTYGQCCNSETWRCGRDTNDCTQGVCYSGACWGHKKYTVNGRCGMDYVNRLCAGKWGDCCSVGGVCGTGEEFCGDGNCQSGNCLVEKGEPPDAI